MKTCCGSLHGDSVKKERAFQEVPKVKKKCSLDSTCSDDSGYEHIDGPELMIHRQNFLMHNKKVSVSEIEKNWFLEET